MNKISLTIVVVLCFAISAFTQTSSISKGSIVIPKFTFKWSDFDSSWGGFLKLNLKIEQDISGNLTLNGNENWKAIPLFPAYDGSSTGLKDNLYRTEYSTSSIITYKVSKIERKKGFAEVNLSKLNDRVVDVKLLFGNSVKDVDKALNEVLFLGEIEEFKKSDHYQNVLVKETNKLPKELSELSQDAKVSLLEDVNYQSNAVWTEIFKEKKYVACSYSDGTEYNTNQINQAERITRTIQKYLPIVKRKGKLLLPAKEVEGVELKVKIFHRNFVNESKTTSEILQFYVPMDSLKSFIEADITDQELVDKSIILLNDSRVRANLSQFSN